MQRTATTPTSGAVLFNYALDFDMPPNPFHETETWRSTTGVVPEFVNLISRNGFYYADPLSEVDVIGAPVVLDEPYGPYDQGTMIRLDLGELDVGEAVTFTMYLSVTDSTAAATNAIDQVDPAIYAFAEPGSGPDVPGGVIGMVAVSGMQYHLAPAGSGTGPT